MVQARDRRRFSGVAFINFKAFRRFTLNLRPFNILVGPNNAGKSTIITAFRILAAAMRRAEARKAEIVMGPAGQTHGHRIDLSGISVADENIFYNYDDSVPASITFLLSGGNNLILYFPEQGVCHLVPDAQGRQCFSPSTFKSNFNCPIGFVPILGPVEHDEQRYDREAARQALFNYRAARNFRNIWFHFPDKFAEFRDAIQRTWPGMDIQPPELRFIDQKPILHMYCPEERIPREIVWAGFGFQVWCQMLTHVIQSGEKSIFLIDEPDIYLHSDLQRQLLSILRNLGPDIVIATHSTEMLTEAEAEDIVVVNKKARSGYRIKNPSQLEEVFRLLGSNVNPILTQLAKTRRALFVEGKDFQIFGRLAKRLGCQSVSGRAGFAVVPVEGSNPERIKNLKAGMETTLGAEVAAAAILDRDYRSESECEHILKKCGDFCQFAIIHRCKEVENFLLVPSAIDRAARARAKDRKQRTGNDAIYSEDAERILVDFAEEKRHYVLSQFLERRSQFERECKSGLSSSTINQAEISTFERRWSSVDERLLMIPGKEALSHVNRLLQERSGITVTATAIIDAMRLYEVPEEARMLIERIDEFSSLAPTGGSIEECS